MSLRIAFQMEPMDQVNPLKNNTLTLMEAAQARGHACYQYHPTELRLTHEGVYARARCVTLNKQSTDFYVLSEDEVLDLAEVDAVLIRQDPPFNMEYITATYALERIKHTTLVVNDPTEIRNAPEKIFPLELQEFIPPTLITADSEAIKGFYEEYQDIIIKPLYLFGGEGVFHFHKGNSTNLEPAVQQMLKEQQCPIVAQKFIPEVSQGDTRILLLDGEIAGAFLRVPEQGSVRANLMAGGALHKTEIRSHYHAICEALKPLLQSRGLTICGIDLIGNYLTEINTTSPIGFREIATLYGRNPADDFWQWVEKRLTA